MSWMLCESDPITSGVMANPAGSAVRLPSGGMGTRIKLNEAKPITPPTSTMAQKRGRAASSRVSRGSAPGS